MFPTPSTNEKPFEVIPEKNKRIFRFSTLEAAEKSARKATSKDGIGRAIYGVTGEIANVVQDAMGRVWTDVNQSSCHLL